MTKKKSSQPSPAFSMQGNKDIGFAKKKRSKLKILRNIFFILSLLFFAVLIFTFSFVMGLDEWKNFDPNTIKNMQQSIVLYDMDQNEIGSLYANKNRRYIALEEIPTDVISAFIATEDARFYQHNGVDFVRILGAMIEDIKALSFKQGASTISQQLVKNAYLTSEKSISRKLQEAIMAVKLEKAYTKDEILEMYINYIYYGGGAYGIESAAQRYFGKQAKYLTLSESALLAGIVKAPSRYAPHIDMEKATQRRNLILSLMAEQGFITTNEYNSAKSIDVSLYQDTLSDFEFGYFTDLVLKETRDILNLDIEKVLGGGYKIYTTLDSDLQRYSQSLYLNSENFPQNAINGTPCESATIILDSSTSAIRTCIGGREYTAKLCLNRTTDMQRQPGSTIKPILVYAPAVERNGYLPTSFVLDEVENFNGYTPKNFNNRTMGWVTLRQAVSKSLNIPAVRILDEIGIEQSKLFASNFGISFAPEDNNLSLALGGFSKGVSPKTMCSAYAAFANGGYYSRAFTVQRIEGPEGQTLYNKPSDGYNVISEQSAFLISSMLNSSVESGTSKALKMPEIPLSAKTGTTEFEGTTGNRDAWIVAYNNEYTTCCWMDFDQTSTDQCLSNDITGGSLPANLVRQVYQHIYEDRSAPSLNIPKDVVSVTLDEKALYKKKSALLASAMTPTSDTIDEYFTTDTAPTMYSNLWDIPLAPSDLNITPSEFGYPIISFTPVNEKSTYRLMRKTLSDDSEMMIAEFSNSRSKIEYIDRLVFDNNTYLYYILTVGDNMNANEIPVNGENSSSMVFEYKEKNTAEEVDLAV
jgi:penicillin-binding protein 1A